MDGLYLVVRLFLGGMFVFAAISKLLNLRAAGESIREFGVPEKFSRVVSLLLPIIEMLIGVSLFSDQLARFGSYGAVALLVCFTAAAGINLARGRRPNCRCFGQLHPTPVGLHTIIRNCAFILGSLFLLVYQPGLHLDFVDVLRFGWSNIALTCVVVFMSMQAWSLAHILHQHGRILIRLDRIERGEFSQRSDTSAAHDLANSGLPVLSRAPNFELPLLSGGTSTLISLLSEKKPIVLVFSDPDCNPCVELLPEISRWQAQYSQLMTIALLTRRSTKDSPPASDLYRLRTVFLQQEREVAAKYRSEATPSAVAITVDGVIASKMAVGASSIENLVYQVANFGGTPPTGQPSLPTGLTVGQRAPEFRGADVTGRAIDSRDLFGHRILFVFWNTNCGFCQRMLPDLKQIEQRLLAARFKVVVASSGPVDAIAGMELHSIVTIDDSFELGRQFAVSSTPSAVLVSPEYTIASRAAVGSAAILALVAEGVVQHSSN